MARGIPAPAALDIRIGFRNLSSLVVVRWLQLRKPQNCDVPFNLVKIEMWSGFEVTQYTVPVLIIDVTSSVHACGNESFCLIQG